MLSEKEYLYRFVDSLRIYYDIPGNGPINSVDLVSQDPSIDIDDYPFKTAGLCGIAMVGNKVDTIVLNTNRSNAEQNFDCAHELIHLFKHRDIQGDFKCFTKASPRQNSFLEWQANEGAAQLLVPYQDFIPRFVQYIDGQPSFAYLIPEVLANFYNVTPQVINIRMSSLSYEIDQYRRGVAVEDIVLLSRNRQRHLGIHATPYNAICDFSLAWDAVIG